MYIAASQEREHPAGQLRKKEKKKEHPVSQVLSLL
jgi:hypothetical protein